MTRTVGDAGLLLDCLAASSPDPRDANSMHAPPWQKAAVQAHPPAAASWAATSSVDPLRPLAGLTVGLPAEFHVGGIDGDALAAWEAAAATLEGLGATLVPVSVPAVRCAAHSAHTKARAMSWEPRACAPAALPFPLHIITFAAVTKNAHSHSPTLPRPVTLHSSA